MYLMCPQALVGLGAQGERREEREERERRERGGREGRRRVVNTSDQSLNHSHHQNLG